MKVLLVNPTRTGFDSYINIPLHLLYVAQAIIKGGNYVEIFDAHKDIALKAQRNFDRRMIENQVIEKIIAMDFDVLGIGSIVSSFPFVKRLVEALRKQKPAVPVIIGGGMSIALKDLWFSETSVDFLVESDGELVIQQFLKEYPNMSAVSKIPGLYVRTKEGFQGNIPYLPKNLDYIDFPAWGMLDDLDTYMRMQKGWVNATLPVSMRLRDADRLFPVVMTRGCPYQCTFCYHVNNLYRSHSVEYVVKYLRYLKENYQINYVTTWDDLIMANRQWLMDLSDAIIEAKLDMCIFTSGGKPNLVDVDLLRKMRQAGFVRISYGIESGSQTILNIMKKQTTVAQNYNAVKMSVHAGLFTHLNMVLGMPGETLKTLGETGDFLATLACEKLISSQNLSFSYATGYPGTELYSYMLEKKIVVDTQEYLSLQVGVGEYKYNLCGIPFNILRLIKHYFIMRVDFIYFCKNHQYIKAAVLLSERLCKALFEIVLPARLKKVIKNLLLFKRLNVRKNEK